MEQITRGIRNNNPGNIRFNVANRWNGQIGPDGDGYIIFDTMKNGVRALTKILRTYRNQGCLSIHDTIARWAPPQDNNDTLAYIKDVAKRMQLDTLIPVPADRVRDLVAAIIHHENGQDILEDVLNSGVASAYSYMLIDQVDQEKPK